jgi:hypothetical protein
VRQGILTAKLSQKEGELLGYSVTESKNEFERLLRFSEFGGKTRKLIVQDLTLHPISL